MLFLIDGYNLSHAIEAIESPNAGYDDASLCLTIDAFLRYTKNKAVIYFDGIGPPDKTFIDTLGALKVQYCGRAEEADTFIEHRLKSVTSPHTTVVSNDRRIKKAAYGHAIQNMGCESFWALIHQKMDQKARRSGHAARSRPLTEGETDQWMKFLGFEQ